MLRPTGLGCMSVTLPYRQSSHDARPDDRARGETLQLLVETFCHESEEAIINKIFFWII